LKDPTCIVIFGPQGSEKRTQCAKLVDEYKLPYFEMGAMLRKAKKSNSEIAQLIDNGQLVPDQIVEDLVASFIYSISNYSFLLDGFPRTVRQAEFLSSLLHNLEIPSLIIDLKSYDNSILVKRMIDRGRPDDTLEIIQKRLEIYSSETIPAMERFGELMKSTIIHFNCNQEVQQLFDEISSIVIDAVLPY
jgi:adenylate kinase